MARSVESLKRDPRFGVDSRWSWVTAGFLSLVLCGALMGQQAAGVIFYGIIEAFGVTRQQASWPPVVSGSLLALAAPIMGYLCRRFSCRAVLLVCPLVASASACICFFANDVLFLVVAFGVVHGTAVSGVYVAVNVLVSQHFEKRRTTACCMIFLMSGLNLIYVPPLTELLRSTYGLRGMLLLLGGIILNACPAVIVLRGPAWMDRPDAPSAGNGVELAKHKTAVGNSHSSAFRDESGTAAEKGHTERCLSNTSLTEVRSVRNGTKHVILCNIHPESAKTTQFSEVDNEGYFSALRPFATVAFAINAASFSVVVFGLTTFFLLHVDMAVDRGVTPARAVLLMNAFAAGDLLVRPASGAVIDAGLLSLDVVMLLGYVIQGCAFELFVWLRSFPLMLVCSALIGVSNGSRIALQAPSLTRDFGVEPLPILMGGLVFCQGFVHLTRPFLFGYYRDGQGSYNGIFHVVAVLNAALVFVWLVRVILRRRTTKRRTHMATRL
ncbi:monocarboxylate transporter 12-like [Rhipicephalus microplus]|uniref:monocarboxylate transporter 12-like n=1 Tax=Rhipicephalus microplus TaxID=6941 RepID=UPI0018876E40|nr:monocarboxylate transporter 12-like [Rhipicephalus microplus]XP_037281223.1 monocarboxylate transporter 12-like [Rhipicephalus microplus]